MQSEVAAIEKLLSVNKAAATLAAKEADVARVQRVACDVHRQSEPERLETTPPSFDQAIQLVATAMPAHLAIASLYNSATPRKARTMHRWVEQGGHAGAEEGTSGPRHLIGACWRG